MRKLLIMLGGTLTMVIGQLIGNQLDENGCVSDGGYEWCETTEQCQRPWEIPCKVLSEYCQSSNLQTCRLACDDPICETHNCAMRIGNCCEYVCVDRTIDLAVHECTDTCPPPIPCPMPEMNEGCSYIEPLRDYCGCINSCGSIDCSTRPRSDKGEVCGGYTIEGIIRSCLHGLECVNTINSMIADAPGTCHPICDGIRDNLGNCIDKDCTEWFDGCNICEINQKELSCTEKICDHKKEPRCLVTETIIPNNCLIWYDGCNSCSVSKGNIQTCTLMYCFTTNEPYCQTFTNEPLNDGDICYRFCEDGSQNLINRINDCPTGSRCLNSEISMIVLDNCNENVKRCVPSNEH